MNADISEFLYDSWAIPLECQTDTLADQAKAVIESLQTPLPPLPIGTIVARFGFAPQSKIDDLLTRKPSGALTLAYLFDHIDGLRTASQEILAASEPMAYLASIPTDQLHPTFAENQALQRLCQHYNCVPLVAPPGYIRIAFAQFDHYKSYEQLGRLTRINDAIGMLRDENDQPYRVVFCIGHRDQITPLIARADQDAAKETLDDEERLNVWREDVHAPDAETPTKNTTILTPTTALSTSANQKLLANIIAAAASIGASNIQFKPLENGTTQVLYRVHGNMTYPPAFRNALAPQQAEEIARFLHTKSIARYNDSGKRIEGRLQSPADGQFIFQSGAHETFIRASFIPATNHGTNYHPESISLRLLPRNSIRISLSSLNIRPELQTVIRRHAAAPAGLILLTGGTGSGKSTTIAGVLDTHITLFGDTRHRLSLEHPVERGLAGITQINVHKASFELYMAAVVRHDPDMVWIGEIRDRSTAATCVRTANTGHLAVSTIHANNAPQALPALFSYLRNTSQTSAESVIVTEYDAVDAIALVIAQRLLPKLCPHCRIPLDSDAGSRASAMDAFNEYRAFNNYEPAALKTAGLWVPNAAGCGHDRCVQGIIGEVPVNEYISINSKLRKELRRSSSSGAERLDMNLLESARPYTMHEDAMRLALDGVIPFTETLI